MTSFSDRLRQLRQRESNTQKTKEALRAKAARRERMEKEQWRNEVRALRSLAERFFLTILRSVYSDYLGGRGETYLHPQDRYIDEWIEMHNCTVWI